MKYEVGDKVRIKSLDWYNKNKDNTGRVVCGNLSLGCLNKGYCGKVFTIDKVYIDYYTVKENSAFWNDMMIEGLVEEETKLNIIEEAKTYWDSIKDAWICPDGYIFKDENGNVINATKIVLEKKKKEYPKTYEECKYILGITTPMVRPDYNGDLIVALQRLLICRDAYWKIAGEEMGLDWEPDYCTNQGSPKYCIAYVESQIITAERYIINTILAFPTSEMRDAFYENFKEEIKICKELL